MTICCLERRSRRKGLRFSELAKGAHKAGCGKQAFQAYDIKIKELRSLRCSTINRGPFILEALIRQFEIDCTGCKKRKNGLVTIRRVGDGKNVAS